MRHRPYLPVLIIAGLLSACATTPTAPPIVGKFVGFDTAKGRDFGHGVATATSTGAAGGAYAFGPVGAAVGAVVGAGTGVIVGALNALTDIPCGNSSVDVMFDSPEGVHLTGKTTQVTVCHLRPGDPINYYQDEDGAITISRSQSMIQKTNSGKKTVAAATQEPTAK